MKALMTSAAVAAMLVLPALAQAQEPAPRGQIYAQRQDRVETHSANPRWDVYTSDGCYVGSDPDPRVRDQLAQDPVEGNC